MKCRPGGDTLPKMYTCTAGIVLTGTNQKEVGPVRTAPEVLEITLTGCVGVFRGVNARGDAHSNNNRLV